MSVVGISSKPKFTAPMIMRESLMTAAVTAIVAAFLTKPVNLGVIHAALVTGLVAAAAFGLHLNPQETGVIASLIIVLLGYLMREKLTPVVGTQPPVPVPLVEGPPKT